jgi:hypothetical protein
MIAAFSQLERRAEHFTERGGVVADNRQAAATFWSVERKRSYDDVSTRTHGFSDAFSVGCAIVRFS